MKPKYSIGLFILIIINIYIAYILLPNDLKNETPENVVKEEKSVTTDGVVTDKDCYFLYESNGYVVVYTSDKNTVFEYTDIAVDELPEILRQEIKNGKFIESEEVLYGFLENYSS